MFFTLSLQWLYIDETWNIKILTAILTSIILLSCIALMVVLLVYLFWTLVLREFNHMMVIFNDPCRHDFICKKIERSPTIEHSPDDCVIDIDETADNYYDEILIPYNLFQQFIIFLFKKQYKPGLYFDTVGVYTDHTLINSDKAVINMLDRRVRIQLGKIFEMQNTFDSRNVLFKNAKLTSTSNLEIECYLRDMNLDRDTRSRKLPLDVKLDFRLLISLINSKTTNILVDSNMIKVATTQFRNVSQHINTDSQNLQIKQSFTHLVAFHICNSITQTLSGYHQNF
jgi:hypothetical protein